MAARTLALLLVAACLAGCNVVATREPVLSSDARLTALSFAPGLWVMDDKSCTFDPGAPRASWPECAQWFVNRDHRLIFNGDAAKGLDTPDGKAIDASALSPYALLAGNPDVLQLGTVEPRYYVYVGVAPVSLNGAGEITRARVWPVACGFNAKGRPIGYRARTPFRGLRFEHPRDQTCTTTSPQAIFNAARRSRRIADVQQAHWVRAVGADGL